MPSRRLSVVVVVVLVLALAAVAVAPAFAAPVAGGLPLHARLVSSTPADGSTVPTATEVTLEINEEVNPDFVTVQVAGPGGAEAEGDPDVDGRIVTQRLATDLPAGEHTVTYRVVSADGHPVSGTFGFTTSAPASASPSPTPTTPASAPATASAAAAAPASSAPSAEEDGSAWLAVALLGVGLLVAAAVTWRMVRGRRPADVSGSGSTADGPGNTGPPA